MDQTMAQRNQLVTSLPEKRSNSGNDNIPEQTPEKRVKIDDLPTPVDSGMKLQSVGKKIVQYCMICGCNTDHDQWECPNRSKGMGMGCFICYDPCDIKEHQENFMPMYKLCVRCEVDGDHWSKDCPSPIYDDDDMYF